MVSLSPTGPDHGTPAPSGGSVSLAPVRASGQVRGSLGPGLEATEIGAVLSQLSRDPEVERMVLFGSRARGDARPGSDLDLLVILRGSLTRERELQWRQRARALLLPVLPVDLDLLISDEATVGHWGGSRWHVLGHIQREGVPLDAA